MEGQRPAPQSPADAGKTVSRPAIIMIAEDEGEVYKERMIKLFKEVMALYEKHPTAAETAVRILSNDNRLNHATYMERFKARMADYMLLAPHFPEGARERARAALDQCMAAAQAYMESIELLAPAMAYIKNHEKDSVKEIRHWARCLSSLLKEVPLEEEDAFAALAARRPRDPRFVTLVACYLTGALFPKRQLLPHLTLSAPILQLEPPKVGPTPSVSSAALLAGPLTVKVPPGAANADFMARVQTLRQRLQQQQQKQGVQLPPPPPPPANKSLKRPMPEAEREGRDASTGAGQLVRGDGPATKKPRLEPQ